MGFCYGWLRNTHDARRMTIVPLFMFTDLKLGWLFFLGVLLFTDVRLSRGHRQATSTVVDRQGVRINFRYASCRIVTPNCRIYMQISLQYYSFVHWNRPHGIKLKASVTWDPKLQSILLSLHTSLLLLSPHLVTEGIAAVSVALVREVRVDRAASQAAESVTIGTGTLRSITVLARRRNGSVELDPVIPGTKDAALSTASVTVTGAA